MHIILLIIGNVYINTYRHDFPVYPLINGLSDHDLQIITLINIFISVPRRVFFLSRKIDSNTVSIFIFLLSYENWDNGFCGKNVNIIFSNFLSTSEYSLQVSQLLN